MHKYNFIPGVVGLDLSITSTGFSRTCLRGGKVITCRIGTKPKDGSMPYRQHLIWTNIKELSKTNDLFVIENSSFASRNSIFILSELAGVIKYNLFTQLSSNVILVAPTTLKKWATGKGQGKKDQIRLGVYKKYNCLELNSDDEIDAYVLSDIGVHMLDYVGYTLPCRKRLKYEEECLNTIIKNKDNEIKIQNILNDMDEPLTEKQIIRTARNIV